MIGLSLKEKHFSQIIETNPNIDFFEIHGENYFDSYSKNFETLVEISKNYPISIHCVGLSLGSVEDLDMSHLENLKSLSQEIKPIFISEHLSWARNKDHNFLDLLPIPYTKESLDIFAKKIDIIQDKLSTQILIENPSRYLDYNCHEYNETEFLNKLCEISGCGLILDINNVFVSSYNLNLDAQKYLQEINSNFVNEIHLAGPELDIDRNILIDNHGSKVREEVLALTKDYLLNKNDSPAILIEWDNNIPEFNDFMNERNRDKEFLC